MSKKFYRFFDGLLLSQEKWLNKMAENGLRLTNTTISTYEFEECSPNQYQYCVEYIGNKSKQNADDYVHFLEDCGYRVFFKNINLNYSAGKVVVRPWAEKGGKISTTSTTFNKELLIVEKLNDGTPFELHTTYEDKEKYYKELQKPWFFLFLVSTICAVLMYFTMKTWTASIVWGIFSLMSLLGLIIFQKQLNELKRQKNTIEW